MQPREGKLHLRLGARPAGDAMPDDACCQVIEQRRFADASLTAQDEYGAPPGLHPQDELFEGIALVVSAA